MHHFYGGGTRPIAFLTTKNGNVILDCSEAVSVVLTVLADLLLRPLSEADSAHGHAVDTRLPEVELGVDLLDVTEDILPVQVHGAVLAELAAPADQRDGQEDGAGDVRLLRHSVGLPHVALHEVQCVTLHSYARELD